MYFHSMKIKVCGMRDKENVAQLVELNPDYIGFIFYGKSKRYAGDVLNNETIGLVPDDIKRVGVFVNASEREINHAWEYFDLDMLQLHGDESPEFCASMKAKGYHVIKAFGVDKTFDFDKLEAYKPSVDFFLFDTKSENYGGTGETYDWSILKKYDQTTPFFLSGGISPSNLDKIAELDGLNIHAIDVNSKFELSPGSKDIDLLRSTVFKKFR